MFSTSVLIFAALISTALAGPWANICASKSFNEIRTCDSYGCGHYSAQRTQRRHPGVDVLCSDDSVVYAPFTGTIMGQEKPHGNVNTINNGIRLTGRGAGDATTQFSKVAVVTYASAKSWRVPVAPHRLRAFLLSGLGAVPTLWFSSAFP